mgnify:CR=1 FL=1
MSEHISRWLLIETETDTETEGGNYLQTSWKVKCAPTVLPTRGIRDREKWRKIEKERERKRRI